MPLACALSKYANFIRTRARSSRGPFIYRTMSPDTREECRETRQASCRCALCVASAHSYPAGTNDTRTIISTFRRGVTAFRCAIANKLARQAKVQQAETNETNKKTACGYIILILHLYSLLSAGLAHNLHLTLRAHSDGTSTHNIHECARSPARTSFTSAQAHINVN